MKEVVTVITTTINFSKETSSAFIIFECINTVLVSFLSVLLYIDMHVDILLVIGSWDPNIMVTCAKKSL